MNRTLIALFLLLAGMTLAACTTPDDEAERAAAKKNAPPPAALVVPKSGDDKEWKIYLQQVVQRNMAGVTDRVFPYYLPNGSTVPTPEDQDGKSMYDRQMENVATVISRTVLPGNMLVFGSPDSPKMADLIVTSFTGAPADALKGSQVLFIGSAADSPRVQAAVEATGGKYIFVEAK